MVDINLIEPGTHLRCFLSVSCKLEGGIEASQSAVYLFRVFTVGRSLRFDKEIENART